MDTGLADKLGDKPVEPLFARIDAIKDKKDVAAVAAYLDSKTPTGIFFRFGVEQDQKDSTKQIEGIHQGGLTLPDRDYYLQDDPHMQAIRAKYHDYIVAVMKLTGESEIRPRPTPITSLKSKPRWPKARRRVATCATRRSATTS